MTEFSSIRSVFSTWTTTLIGRVLHTLSIRQRSKFTWSFSWDQTCLYCRLIKINRGRISTQYKAAVLAFSYEQTNLRLNSAYLRSDPTGLNSDHNFSFFWSYFQEPNSQFQFFRRIFISNFHNLLKDLGIKFSAANIPIVCSLVLSQQLLAVKSWFAFYKTIVEIVLSSW